MTVLTKVNNRLHATRHGLNTIGDSVRSRQHRAAISELVRCVDGMLEYADQTLAGRGDKEWLDRPSTERLRAEFERWAASKLITIERCDDPQNGIEAYTSPELTAAWAAVLYMDKVRK